MGFLSGFAMVAAGALCLGGAISARQRIGIVASTVMLLAMLDLTVSHFVAPVFWAAALIAVTVLLGFGLRDRGAAGHDPAHRDPLAQRAWLPRGVMIAAALAYPATAWLVLSHGDHVGGTTGGSGSGTGNPAATGASHAHHGAGTLTSALPLAVVILLIAVLLGLGALAVRDRRAHPAAEAGGMAVMLLAMLVGHG